MTDLPLLRTLEFAHNLLTNLSGLSNLPQLDWLGLRDNKFVIAPTISGFPNLHTIDLHTNLLTDLSGMSGATTLTGLNLIANNLQDINPITGLVNLDYTDLRYNLLNTNSGSAAMLQIAILQDNGTYVDFIPQRSTAAPTVVLLSPTWLGGNQFRFTIQGDAGNVVRLQSSTNLTVWSFLAYVTNLIGTTNYTDSSANGGRKYYNAR